METGEVSSGGSRGGRKSRRGRGRRARSAGKAGDEGASCLGSRVRLVEDVAVLAASLAPALISDPQWEAEKGGDKVALVPSLPVADLPVDVLHRLFTLLPVTSLALLSQTCRRLATTSRDDRAVWRLLCQRDFSRHTDIDAWMQTSTSAPSASHPLVQRNFDYRSLYRLLHHHRPLIGYWRGLGELDGSLLHFGWRRDCIRGTQLVVLRGEGNGGRLGELPFQTFDGRADACAEADFLDGSLCEITEQTGWGMRRVDSGRMRAEAAASVAGGTGVDALLMGTSPEGSFGAEFVRFMQGNVDPGRRKAKKKSPGRHHSWGERPITHHLVRLSVSKPTAVHPLAGLWTGCCRDGRLHVINILYCFASQRATIAAVKVLGDELVPVGERLWEASASPIRKLSPAETSHILEADHRPAHVAPTGEGNVMASTAVASVRQGRGLARQVHPLRRGFMEGRLWGYQDGDLGFCWIDGDDRSVIRFQRVSEPS